MQLASMRLAVLAQLLAAAHTTGVAQGLTAFSNLPVALEAGGVRQLVLPTSIPVKTDDAFDRSAWRHYQLYQPNVTRGFVVDASLPPLQENHDSSIQWFEGQFIATWNGAQNTSFLTKHQLIRVAVSTDGVSWADSKALHEAACDNLTECNQWQPTMIVVRPPHSRPVLWAFWSQFQSGGIYKSPPKQSAWFMSVLDDGGIWKHRRFDGPFADTTGSQWRLFPTQDPVQLSTGRVLVPVSMLPSATPSNRATNSVLMTDDFGGTFKLSPGTSTPSATASLTWEPVVWEDEATDAVHMMVRSTSYGDPSQAVLQHSVSHTGGSTWSALATIPIDSVPNRPGESMRNFWKTISNRGLEDYLSRAVADESRFCHAFK